MAELRSELEEAQSNELCEAKKAAADARANLTSSMDSLDGEVIHKLNDSVCSTKLT